MKTIIVYASNSGNTLAASRHISDVLTRAGHDVTIRNVAETDPDELAGYGLRILGCPSWLRQTPEGPLEGQLQQQWYDFAETLRGSPAKANLSEKPFAVFAMGRHEYTHFCGAADKLEELVGQLGGMLVIDSLRVDGFVQHNTEQIEQWADRLATKMPELAAVSTSS